MGPQLTAWVPPALVRREGWEGRLAAVAAAASTMPYEIGTHDCFRFACACAQALTGADLYAPWSGRYRTRIGGLRLIGAFAAGGARAGIGRLLGVAEQPARLARRGDWLLYRDAGGEHIGVCLGGTVAVLGEHGLQQAGFDDCICCWPVG